MSAQSGRNIPWLDLEADTDDKRRRRGGHNRMKIIEAMFVLMRQGNMTPSAAQVAEHAGVGLRTVFNHFQDMDSIFEEMTDELRAVTTPKIVAPYRATTWRERLFELADRNADLYEDIFPMQVALVIRRFQSDFLTRQYKQEVNMLRSSLKAILPIEIQSNRPLFAAIEVNLTFATWRRLREDQGLSVARSKETLQLIMKQLICNVDVE